ncbi:MAG: hypothetical protein ABL958_02160 [Bdellovibrionia bacterium]
MRRNSFFQAHSVYADAALIGAHANAAEGGFRQRDFTFLIELFSNWMDATLEGQSIPVHNTQSLRLLEESTRQGWLKKIARPRAPRYVLTPAGLVETAKRLVNRTHIGRLEEFFFLYFFVNTYRQRISDLTDGKSMTFAATMKVELEHTLDPSALLSRQIALVKKEISKLEERVREGFAASSLATDGFKGGQTLAHVIDDVQRHFPYELNNQKPLPELMSGLPEGVQRWELEEGPRKRAERLWNPSKKLLKSYLDALEDLGV